MSATLTLTASSPVQSFAEVLEVAEVESFLLLPSITDPARTALLEGFIAGAREQAEILQGCDLIPKQYDLTRDCFPCYEIKLRDRLVSVDLVQIKDCFGALHVMTENADYIVDTAKRPGVIMPPYGCSWPTYTPWPSSAVLVRFTAGIAATDAFWSDAGHMVKIGMQHLISAWFNNRLPFEMGANAIQEYPFTVTALLSAGSIPRVR